MRIPPKSKSEKSIDLHRRCWDQSGMIHQLEWTANHRLREMHFTIFEEWFLKDLRNKLLESEEYYCIFESENLIISQMDFLADVFFTASFKKASL